jgi:hypothetical protein
MKENLAAAITAPAKSSHISHNGHVSGSSQFTLGGVHWSRFRSTQGREKIMRAKLGMVVGGFMVLAFTCVAMAQFGMMTTPEVRGVFNPVVGEGASYQLVEEKGTKQFDIAIIGKDSSGGFWTEYSMQDPKGQTVYAKQLIMRQGTDAFVQRMIVQAPGQPPMEFSSTMQRMQGKDQKPQKLDFRAEAQDLGTESVTTPAGTFSCHHWRTTKDNTDVWISDKVKPWGLVKMSGKSSGTLTVTKLITDAKTHITGTPVSLEEMMKQKMGRQ